jgi:hypothetical protein
MKRTLFLLAALSAVLAAPAAAQMGGRLSVEPYVGYGFFGSLPGTDASLEADLAYGGRAAFQLADQWAVFGNYQRSTPAVTGSLPLDLEIDMGDLRVDHWSAGVEFSYVPRGGAEGMLPILLEAGLGQARYAGDVNDLAVNLGIGSALQLTPNLGIRYGASDYISNHRNGDGIVNQIFVRLGGELRF